MFMLFHEPLMIHGSLTIDDNESGRKLVDGHNLSDKLLKIIKVYIRITNNFLWKVKGDDKDPYD